MGPRISKRACVSVCSTVVLSVHRSVCNAYFQNPQKIYEDMKCTADTRIACKHTHALTLGQARIILYYGAWIDEWVLTWGNKGVRAHLTFGVIAYCHVTSEVLSPCPGNQTYFILCPENQTYFIACTGLPSACPSIGCAWIDLLRIYQASVAPCPTAAQHTTNLWFLLFQGNLRLSLACAILFCFSGNPRLPCLSSW